MLSKQWLVNITSTLLVCSITTPQSTVAENAIATASSIDKAPYSKVFTTGTVYAVRDHDFEGSEPSIGVSTFWVKKPADKQFLLGVRYCIPENSLIDSDATLTSMMLLKDNKPLVTFEQPIKVTPAHQRVIQTSIVGSAYGFWEPGTYWYNDGFYDDFGNPFWSSGAALPSVTCSAGSGRFNIASFTNTISQLTSETLQMKLTFSNGAISQWRLGKKTVQALKELITIDPTNTD
ncbi:hypothetical protein NIES2101_29785 [Calothrix sp. HK-06]|nr:hypothetical protein NIES2101_29785 [Calothrix sp. HK-06]